MEYEVEFTDEFGEWWEGLSLAEQESVATVIELLRLSGTDLKHPYSSGISTSKHKHMRKLRIQHAGDPYRVLYAFDPRRAAILLLGGNKRGDDRWYERNVPRADRIYDEYLAELEREGELDG